MKKMVAPFLLAGLALVGMTGCDTTTAMAPQNAPLTGAVTGGLLGAGIGQLAGGNTKSTLIGAGVGTLGGAMVGQQIQNNHQQQQIQGMQMQGAYHQGVNDGRYGAPPPPPAPRAY